MNALIFNGKNLELVNDLEVHSPGPDQVKIEVKACGLCQSDLSVKSGKIPWPSPVVLGHEPAGIVAEVGSNVTTLEVGDHVVVHTVANCGHCAYCESGKPTHCRQSLANPSTPFHRNGEDVYNFAASSGFTEYTLVNQHQAVVINSEVPFTSACLIACGVVTGVGAVLNRARVRAGETAVVFGVGGVGLNVIQGLRIAAATRIIAVDLVDQKESVAREFGATDFINPTKLEGDLASTIRQLLPHSSESDSGPFSAGGVDWSFECTGIAAVLDDAVQCLDWGGNCVIIGVEAPDATYQLPIQHLAYVDRGIMGCRYGGTRPHRDIPKLVDLYLDGRLKLDELVTQQYKLDDYQQAMDDLAAGKLARGVFTF